MYGYTGRRYLRVALIKTPKGLRWATCYKEQDYILGPLKRYRSKYLPPRFTREKAEADLKRWAEARDLRDIDDDVSKW